MKRRTLSRRDLIKGFGPLAFLLLPISRSMGYVAGGSFATAPRYVMFFRGAGYHSPTVHEINTIDELDKNKLNPLVPLKAHAADLILFKHMSIHDGSPKTDGYQEEHAGGLMGCVTGHSFHYYENDSYMAYTDHQSFDVMLADHYKTRPELAALPFASLHIGAGAQSDCDDCGLGQKYISYTNRVGPVGNDYFSNAIVPVQNPSQVYQMMMQRIELLCSDDPKQAPPVDNSAQRAALERKQSLLDFRMADIVAAKNRFGMDSEHAQKLDALLTNWREVEKTTTAQLAALSAGGSPSTLACPTALDPGGGNGTGNDCGKLSPIHDQMIDLIQLAFSWDLTRVVAFTLSGASSGHRWPAMGVNQSHHSLEHSRNVTQLNVIDGYFSEKYARLLQKLKEVDDGDGKSALYNSAVLLGSECWSSGGHYMEDVPFILGGQGGGHFESGRVVDAGGRSNNDIYISIQNAAGISSNAFGLSSLCRGPIV